MKHSLLLQKLAGGKIDGIDMRKLLVRGLRGIGDGQRIVDDQRPVRLADAVAAVDVADGLLFLRGGIDGLLRVGEDGCLLYTSPSPRDA